MNNWMGQTFKYKQNLKWYKCFIHYHKGWISVQVALLKGKQKSLQTASSHALSVWSWHLSKRSCSIWLLLRSEVLSTQFKSATQRFSSGLTLLLKTLYQHRTGIILVQEQHTPCKGINSLELLLPLTGSNSMKLTVNGFMSRDDLALNILESHTPSIHTQWIICFFSDILFDMDCHSCVHSAFRLKVVWARTQGLYHQFRPIKRK